MPNHLSVRSVFFVLRQLFVQTVPKIGSFVHKKNLNTGKYILYCLLVFLSVKVPAMEVSGLYQVDLPAEKTDLGHRLGLTRKGLQEVLIRVSGGSEVLSHELIKQALTKPDHYLQQFSYQTEEISTAEGVENNIEQLRLYLFFDPTLIDSLLRQARMPIWGKNRPNLMLWITIEDDQGRHILTAADDSPIKQSIADQAKRRGLPILFPLMDLTDEAELSIVEAWALFKEPLERASKRYQPEAILAGRLYQEVEGQWSGRWHFIFNGQAQGFNSAAPDLASYPVSAIDFVADQLGGYYAVNTAIKQGGFVAVQVEGINSLQDYAEATAYLENLTSVMRVDIIAVEQNRLTLSLTTEGQVEKLVEAIALGHKLIPLNKANQRNGTERLYYSWYRR